MTQFLPAAAHLGEPLFFAFFDLINWKNYGIMVEYEKNNLE